MKHRVRAAVLAAAATFLLGGCAQSDAKRLYAEAGKALEASDFETAAATYSKVIDSEYYVSESYRGKGIAEMSLGDYPDAAVSLEKSLLYVDEQSEAFQRDVSLYLAHCRERQSKSDKAMEIYDSLILRAPDAETLFLRGRLNLRLDNGKAAESDFNQAVLMNPGYDLYINIYQIYDDMERSGDGARYLEMALSEASKHEEDYYEQGLVSYYLQNYSDARDMLVKAMKKDPEDGKSVFLLGKVYLASGDIANARALYRDYSEREGTAAAALNGLALCDMEEGNDESALAYVEKGLEYNDASANQGLLYNELVLYERLHNWSAAKKKAAAYVTKYPADEAGLREYEFLLTR